MESDGILLLPHMETLSTAEALRYLIETKKVNIKSSFIRELLYCAKFNGNKDLVDLASDIMQKAENASELHGEFKSNDWGNIVYQLQEKFNRSGSWGHTLEDCLLIAGYSPSEVENILKHKQDDVETDRDVP